jgi:hypothetical protein
MNEIHILQGTNDEWLQNFGLKMKRRNYVENQDMNDGLLLKSIAVK